MARPKRTLQSDDSIIYPELAKFTELIICVYPISLMSRLTTKQHEGNPAVKKGVTKVATTVVSRGKNQKSSNVANTTVLSWSWVSNVQRDGCKFRDEIDFEMCSRRETLVEMRHVFCVFPMDVTCCVHRINMNVVIHMK